MATPGEAATVISTIMGSAGLSGFAAAVLGYLAAVRKGRQGEPEKALAGGLALVADGESVDRLTSSIEGLNVHIKTVSVQFERAIHLTGKTQETLSVRLDDMVEEHRKLRRSIEDMRLRRANEPR